MTSAKKELTVEKIRPGGQIVTMHGTTLKITEIIEDIPSKIKVIVEDIHTHKPDPKNLIFFKTPLGRIKLTGCRKYIPKPEEE